MSTGPRRGHKCGPRPCRVAVPADDGLTVGEQCAVAARYLARAHWRAYNVRELGDVVVLWLEGEVAFRVYELSHRGRLDLSGRDVVDRRIAGRARRRRERFAKRCNTSSQHVIARQWRRRNSAVRSPGRDGAGRMDAQNSAREIVGGSTAGHYLAILERFYVRARRPAARSGLSRPRLLLAWRHTSRVSSNKTFDHPRLSTWRCMSTWWRASGAATRRAGRPPGGK